MRISHWLTRLQNRRPVRKSRRAKSQTATESLESRTLLTTVGILTGPTELTVFVDDGDSATVQRNSTTGNVEVLDANGQPYQSIPSVQASQLTSLNIFADDADNTLSVAPVNSSEFSMLNTIVIESGDGDDVITGSDDFGEMIDADDGNDTIIGGGGDDTIDAGNGADLVSGGAGIDSILGDDGDDTIDGGTGNDNIDAGDGQDSVDGGDGDDVINAGDGLDTVNGGAGADFINGMSGTDLLNGDADNDTILGGNENDTVNGGDGNDIVNGQAGNDTVSGDAGDDTGYGGGGRDVLFGGDGDDIVNGQSGNDTIDGGAGMDRGYGGSGNDSLDGGTGNDTMRGHSGNDTLFGGGDADNLDGGSGNDLVTSGDVDPDTGTAVVLPQLSVDDVTVNPEGDGQAIVSFGPPGTFGLGGNNAQRFRSADFNGDGFLDLAIPYFISNGDFQPDFLSVLLNNGNGTFGAATNFQVGASPMDVATGDIDGDGDIDIITANEASEDISILFNNGMGGFAPAVNLPTNGGQLSQSFSVETVDLDADSDLDLVVAIGSPGAAVFLNNGDGTFAAPTITTALPSRFVRAFDADNDGDQDLAFITSTGATGGTRITIVQNNGSGALGGGIGNTVADSVEELDFGDLDGDGNLDIVVAGGSINNNVFTFIGNGDATFQNGATLNVGQQSPNVATADFNLDGAIDIAVGSTAGGGPILFINDGAGNFPTTLSLNAGFSTNVEAEDYNNDGAPDIAFAVGATATVLLNTTPPQSTGTFTVSLSQPSTSTVTVSYATADGTATDGVDYEGTGGVLTFDPGVTTQTVTIPVIGDTDVEPNENFFLNLSMPTNATIGDSQGHAAITDDDGGTAGPVFSVSDPMITEGDMGTSTLTFSVSLSAAAGGTVTVDYATQDNTAVVNEDYLSASGTLTFGPADTSQDVTVNIVGDLIAESTESFFLNLFDPSGILLQDSQGEATITDNDAGVVIVVSPDDTLSGGSGNDTLIGDLGDDQLDGGTGNDSLSGAGGDDSIQGGDGNDTIDGGSGDDTIAGQGGDDVITAGDGIDTVIWDGLGNGDDTLMASDGAEILTVQGDSGVNNYDIDSNNGLLRVTEGAASITVATSTTTVNVNGGSDDDVIKIGELADVNPLVLNIDGQADNDTITAVDSNIGDVRLRLNGGTGNDTITGSRDSDSINGDGGDDSVFGGPGNDTIDGGDGNDTLNGEAGNDLLLGNTGNDLMNGGDGDDVASGSLGNDTAIGGLGNDTLMGGFGNDVLNGNSGNDLADGGRDNDQVLGGSGDDSLKGGTGDDTVRGQSGDDLIKGGDGDDRITGDSGNDIIDAGDGDDDVDGGNGDDIATGSDGNDTINGMSGADTLLGGDGADNQLGGAGVDSLYGQEGDDSLNGGSSTDQFNGGEGADVLISPDAGEFDDNNLAIEASVMEALALLNGF